DREPDSHRLRGRQPHVRCEWHRIEHGALGLHHHDHARHAKWGGDHRGRDRVHDLDPLDLDLRPGRQRGHCGRRDGVRHGRQGVLGAWGGPAAPGAVSIGRVPGTAAELANLTLHSRGKVREMYDLGDQLLMVASDRVSTYDVVLPTPIPDKGKVLTGLSVFWFGRTQDIVPNHLISTDVPDEARGRGLLVRKLEIFPVECVVRGYLSGSGWKEYKQSQA